MRALGFSGLNDKRGTDLGFIFFASGKMMVRSGVQTAQKGLRLSIFQLMRARCVRSRFRFKQSDLGSTGCNANLN